MITISWDSGILYTVLMGIEIHGRSANLNDRQFDVYPHFLQVGSNFLVVELHPSKIHSQFQFETRSSVDRVLYAPREA